MMSFDTKVRQMPEMSQWPKCHSKKWPKCLIEKKSLAALNSYASNFLNAIVWYLCKQLQSFKPTYHKTNTF